MKCIYTKPELENLSQSERIAVEIVTQLAFYCGWTKAWSVFSLIE